MFYQSMILWLLFQILRWQISDIDLVANRFAIGSVAMFHFFEFSNYVDFHWGGVPSSFSSFSVVVGIAIW